MKLTPLALWIAVLLPTFAFADNFTLTDGREYKDVTVTRVEPDGIVVLTDSGVEKLPFNLLPKEVQLVYPYKAATPAPVATPTPVPTEPPVVKPASNPQSAANGADENSANGNESLSGKNGFHAGMVRYFVARALLSFLVLFAAMLVGWFIVCRLLAAWARRQKEHEFDAANAQQFYTAYADFFAIWKLWNFYLDRSENELPDHGEYEIPHASRWDLLTRASIAEGVLDTVFLKLTASRRLTAGDVELLGRFRQAFQTLSQVIKANKPLNWKDAEHPDCLVFKRLASCVAILIGGESKSSQSVDQHADAFRQVTSARWDRAWNSESTPDSGGRK